MKTGLPANKLKLNFGKFFLNQEPIKNPWFMNFIKLIAHFEHSE